MLIFFGIVSNILSKGGLRMDEDLFLWQKTLFLEILGQRRFLERLTYEDVYWLFKIFKDLKKRKRIEKKYGKNKIQ